jgi:hypothetical protein
MNHYRHPPSARNQAGKALAITCLAIVGFFALMMLLGLFVLLNT